MRVVINGDYQPILTFLIHLAVIDWLWKILEINLDGEIQGKWSDSVILILVCAYITWALR